MASAATDGEQLLTTTTETAAAAAAAAAATAAEAAGTAATLISAREEAETTSAASACASTSKEDPPRSQRIKVVLDMETSDPDDMITLCFLADHPNIDLRAVTLTPGTRMQVGLVRAALQALGHREIPIGAGNLDHPNDCVSAWHQKIGLRYEPSSDAEVAWKVLVRECDTDTTLMTGGPLKNIGAAIRESKGAFTCGRWVGQGGFAGEGVVPDDVKWPGNLSEFRHKRVCPTFNFGGDAKSAELAVSYQGFAEIRLVSKNVCHLNVFTQENQTELESLLTRIPTRACPGMRLVARGMDNYCSKGRGKKLHDPLAATCILDLSVCRWEEVKVIHEGALWGSVKLAGTNCFISVDYRPEAFWGVFVSAIMQEAVAADERRKRQSSSSSSSSLRRSVAASAAEAE